MLGYLKYLFGSLILAAALIGIVWLIAWRVFDLEFYSVQSNSMAPVFQRGDLLIEAKAEPLKIGDVVIYQSSQRPGQLVSHRLISIRGGLLQTKGDALSTADPSISKTAVRGRALAVMPKAGFIFDELRRPIGLIALVYMPALLITITELWLLTGRYGYRPYGLPKTA